MATKPLLEHGHEELPQAQQDEQVPAAHQRKCRCWRTRYWVIIAAVIFSSIIILTVILMVYYPPYSTGTQCSFGGNVMSILVNCTNAAVTIESTDAEEISIETNVQTFYKDIYNGINISVVVSEDGKHIEVTETDTINVLGTGLLTQVLTLISIKLYLPKLSRSVLFPDDYKIFDGMDIKVCIEKGRFFLDMSEHSEFEVNSFNVTTSDGSITLHNSYASKITVWGRKGNVMFSNLVVLKSGNAEIKSDNGDIIGDKLIVGRNGKVTLQASSGKACLKVAPEYSCFRFTLTGERKIAYHEYGPGHYIINLETYERYVSGLLTSEKCYDTTVNVSGDDVILLLAQESVLSW